jgi:hypothetical protein
MFSFLKPRREPEHDVSAFADLRAFFAQMREQEHRWWFLCLAVLMPVLLIWGFFIDSTIEIEYRPPEITWFETWEKGRTPAQVRAQQAKDLPAERAAKAAEIAESEARKAEFRKVADMFGIEVEK